jgi:hypothetical protein
MASTFKLDSIDIISNDSATQSWGSAVAGLGYTFHRIVKYECATNTTTQSHSYSKDTGVTAVLVYVTGGGGGGGSGENNYNSKSGGYGGGTAIKWITGSTSDSSGTFASQSSITVTAGKGGTGGASSIANGTDGGTSSFGAFCTATGGHGGFNDAATARNGAGGRSTGQEPGVGTGGDINIYGGDARGYQGGDGTDELHGSEGGGSFWGGSTKPVNATLSTQLDVGSDALIYGAGGGSGDQAGSGSNTQAGGDGKCGIVVIYEYKGG